MTSEEKNNIAKRAVAAAAGVLLAAAFIAFCPDIGLGEQGMRCLGILFGAVVWWIAGVLPTYATAIIMVVLFAVVGGIDSSIALSGFSSNTWWLLVAAFGLGAGMKRSGLLRRMALAVVRTFPNTFVAQVAGLMVAGTAVGPLVPSMAAKVSMLTPLAMGIGDALGYERYGRQMQGLFLAMFCGVRTIAPAVLSASVIGYCLFGLLPADVQAQFDMMHWLLAALPWFVVTITLTFVSICLLYRPREADAPARLSTPESESNPSDASAKPAPMSRHEKQMCLIVAVTVVLWVAEPLHHVAAHLVTLAAFVLTVACGILGKTGFREDITWESLVFVGVAMGLSNVFAAAGIQDWVVTVAGPAFQALAGNPFLFVMGAAAITLALRFLIVSEMAYLNIVMVFLVPLSLSVGVNPWVTGFAMYAVITPWFTLYQSATYLAAFYSVDGKMAHHADLAKYCVLYTAICMLALVVSVPYWQWLGLL